MNEFYNRMNIKNGGKTEVALQILTKFNDKDTLVIDVGAGTCVIDKMLLEADFKGSIIAIDHNDNCDIKPTNNFQFLCNDLLLSMTDLMLFQLPTEKYKTIVIILSAILHELSKEDLQYLSFLINTFTSFSYVNVNLIIREPIDTNLLIKKTFEIHNSKEFKEYKKIHVSNNWSEEITFINFCFLKSYGPNSWDREKHEGRFTYNDEEIHDFVKKCGLEILAVTYEQDEFYKNTLPFDMYDNISYTGTLLECGRRK